MIFYPLDRRGPLSSLRRWPRQPHRRGTPWCWLTLLTLALVGGCAQPTRWTGVEATVVTVASAGGGVAERPSAAVLPQGAPAEDGPAYRIGPGDELVVTVWGRPDLGSQVPAPDGSRRNLTLVRPDGSIGLPLIGTVAVAGKTEAEAAASLAGAYRAIVPEPMVEVAVATARARHVTLSGAVRRPGNVFLGPTVVTLADAISAAGGLSEAADSAAGVLVRGGQTFTIDYLGGERGLSDVQHLLLQPGDGIFFPVYAEQLVYVLGEVNRPGVRPIPPYGLTLLGALTAAGGLDPRSGDQRRIYLLRPGGLDARIHELTLRDILSAPELALSPGDRIFVPPTDLAVWERTWRQLLPFFTTGQAASQSQRYLTE